MAEIKLLHDLAKECKCQNDYVGMEKYYKQAIKLGDNNAMFKLGFYYQNLSKPKMKKYYKMAIKHGNISAIYFLSSYYEENDHIEGLNFFYKYDDLESWKRVLNKIILSSTDQALICHLLSVKKEKFKTNLPPVILYLIQLLEPVYLE